MVFAVLFNKWLAIAHVAFLALSTADRYVH
jgi:hypothetical protein